MAMAESVLQDAYEGEDREGGGGQLCLRHSSVAGVCCYTQQQPDPLFRGDYFPFREGGDEPMGWWVCNYMVIYKPMYVQWHNNSSQV
mmetsp:Transcript_8543/g.21184  ORF Transcript_8543/g.21184 Transcript_8543/m.21184 type:complete len:87 (-) Transcript_8543:874-1134(-)